MAQTLEGELENERHQKPFIKAALSGRDPNDWKDEGENG
jgi:hypothetical protein